MLSICNTVDAKGVENCTVSGKDLGQKASFLEDQNGICNMLGEYSTMAAQVVDAGDHHVLHVRYNYSYGEVHQVDISFTVGTDRAPRPLLTEADGVYSVSWAGLATNPPLPAPAPPPPPPTPAPETYLCQ